MDYKQFERTYSGGYRINFPLAFKNINDSKPLNYSNFYLTDRQLITDICDFNAETLKGNTILTKISFSNEYLKYGNINPDPYLPLENFRDRLNYGIGSFVTDINDADTFYISFYDINRCNIYYAKYNIRYYLVVGAENNLFFCEQSKLSFNEYTTNPQDFTYMFSEGNLGLLFFKKNENGNFIVVKSNNYLELKPNIVDYINTPFTIDKNIYTEPNISYNTSFIRYNNTNFINNSKSKYNLKNNYLLHKTIVDPYQNSSIISLKNQLSQIDVFSNANNLLSSKKYDIFVDDFRQYTSICRNVLEEETEDLKLNYVLYNKIYKINPGINTITSPETLYPYSVLNVKDTKFIQNGAFSFISPQFADRIYHISNTEKPQNGQYLLCTWLSGHPQSSEKRWVDRYYYPDLISKEEALVSTPLFTTTYDDYIENLVTGNTDLKVKVSNIKFFDKASDLAFIPNETYEYHRISIIPEVISPIVIPCELNNYPINYFKQINETGEFTLSFYFNGDANESWIMKSDSNDVEHRMIIEKKGNTLLFSFQLFDPSTQKYISYNYECPIVTTKYNLFCVSVNAITGIGYVFVNSSVGYEFNISPYNFIRKQLLYGDFYISSSEITKINVLKFSSTIVKNISVSYKFLDPAYLYLLTIFSEQIIDDIYITLPCGMRNSIDDIEILNDICNSGSFKSNDINIIIKNINEPVAVEDLKTYLNDNLDNILPTNAKVNNIAYKNYKNISDSV